MGAGYIYNLNNLFSLSPCSVLSPALSGGHCVVVEKGPAPYINPMFDELYNTDILTLSASLKNERLSAPDGTSRKVSKLCGSWLEIDVNMEGDTVSECALRVQACALGQSSAAILQQGVIGATLREITEARDSLQLMLKEGGKPPMGRFAKLSLLAGVKAYPARHTSTLLAFEAATEAIESALEHA